MDIILFKAVKELNIGIATAVEMLEEEGFIIENKPTAKLSEEAYEYLKRRPGVKSLIPPSEQKPVSQQKSIFPLQPLPPFYFSPEEGEDDGITSYKILEQVRIRTGVPKSVFKYFPQNENSTSSLREHYLYHSVYTGFNDPFDCNMDLLVNFTKRKAHYSGTKAKFLNKFNNTGICCFTTANNSILMWSHYASHHTGFCLEFKSNRLGGINPLNVVYKKNLKSADYHTKKDDAFFHLIYSKSDCWSYEHELRTFATNLEAVNDRKIPFDKDDLLSVYLGVRCSPEYENQIKIIIKNVYSNKVDLYKAKFADNAFAIGWDKVKLLSQ